LKKEYIDLEPIKNPQYIHFIPPISKKLIMPSFLWRLGLERRHDRNHSNSSNLSGIEWMHFITEMVNIARELIINPLPQIFGNDLFPNIEDFVDFSAIDVLLAFKNRGDTNIDFKVN
jgi:hypothetical protein